MDEEKLQDSAGGNPENVDSRERILRAALAEFHDRGVAGARVDRIAAEAGVNKALIYYYYSSKQNLYEEAIRDYLGDVLSAIVFRIDDAEDFESTFRSIAEQYRDLLVSEPQVPRMLLRELADPNSALVPRLARMIRESGIPGRLQQRLAKAMDAGAIREFDPRQLVTSFITMNLGYYLMAPLLNRVLEIDNYEQFVIERKDSIVDLFLNGVKAR